MKSAYATAAIDPKISTAGSHCEPPSATSRRNSDREEGDIRVPNRIPPIAPIVISLFLLLRSSLGVQCNLQKDTRDGNTPTACFHKLSIKACQSRGSGFSAD